MLIPIEDYFLAVSLFYPWDSSIFLVWQPMNKIPFFKNVQGIFFLFLSSFPFWFLFVDKGEMFWLSLVEIMAFGLYPWKSIISLWHRRHLYFTTIFWKMFGSIRRNKCVSDNMSFLVLKIFSMLYRILNVEWSKRSHQALNTKYLSANAEFVCLFFFFLTMSIFYDMIEEDSEIAYIL